MCKIFNFIMKLSLNLEVSSIYSKLSTGSFCDIAHPYKLFTSQYQRYDDYLFLSWSFMYLLLTFTYWLTEWHIPPVKLFSAINNTLILFKRSNFILVLFKAACYVKPGTVEKQVGSSSYILRHNSKDLKSLDTLFVCT